MALGQIVSDSEARREVSEIEAAAASMGLLAVFQEEPVEELYLWPENVRAWNLFMAMGTQWLVGMNGPTGLNYPGVEVVMRKLGVKRKEDLDVFLKIQVMERATLGAWREQIDG